MVLKLTEKCYYCNSEKGEYKICTSSNVAVNYGSVQMRICCNCGHFALFYGGSPSKDACHVIEPVDLAKKLSDLGSKC